MRDMKLSASRIKTHDKCPKQFEFKYLTEKDPTKAEKGYRELGSAVHESIESALLDYPDEREYSVLRHLMKKEFREYNPDISDKKFDTGLECLDTAAKFISKQNFELKAVEDRIDFVVDRYGVNERAVAILDIVTEDEVWDWKTGRIRGEDTTKEEVQQGSFYMLAHLARYGELPSKMKFIYLKEGKVRQREPEKEDIEEMLDDAKTLIRGMEINTFEPKPEESKCYFCDWEYYCPASPVSYHGIKWEDW